MTKNYRTSIKYKKNREPFENILRIAQQLTDFGYDKFSFSQLIVCSELKS